MIGTDADAFTCDMAETYGVLNWQALPVPLLATLAAGLHADARVRLKAAGLPAAPGTVLLARAVDELAALRWLHTDDAAKGRNRPDSVLQALFAPQPAAREARSFDSGADFEAARAKILKGAGKDGG